MTLLNVPDLGEGIDKGTVTALRVAVGDQVLTGQTVAEIESGKATVEIPAPTDGTITALHVQVGAVVKPGAGLMDIALQAGAPESSAVAPVAKPVVVTQPVPQSAAPEPVRLAEKRPVVAVTTNPLSPSARRQAREAAATSPVQQTEPASSARKGERRSQHGETHREPLGRLRRLTAEHLAKSWPTVPQVTHFADADIVALEDFRHRFADQAKARGIKLTLTALAARAWILVLGTHQRLNACLDLEHQEIVHHDQVHLALAVDTPEGLVVPVIHAAERLDLLGLASSIQDLAQRARDGKLTPADLVGGTATLTNLGGLGAGHFTPLVVAPQSAILGLGRSRVAPRVVGEAIQPRLCLPLSLSYDHRLIDGADAARALADLEALLGDPERLLVGL